MLTKAEDVLGEMLGKATPGPWRACGSKRAPDGWPLSFSMGSSDKLNGESAALAVFGVPASCLVLGDPIDDATAMAALRNLASELLDVLPPALPVLPSCGDCVHSGRVDGDRVFVCKHPGASSVAGLEPEIDGGPSAPPPSWCPFRRTPRNTEGG